jgi:hypothetical protein
MHRSRSTPRSLPRLIGVRGSRHWTSRGSSGPLVAVVVGAVLVVLNALFVLGPVTGLVGAAAGTGPVVDVPVISSTVGVLLGLALAALLLVVAWRARRTALAWVLAVLAWLVSAAGCVWPLVATGFAAADRARDVWPTVLEIVRSVS